VSRGREVLLNGNNRLPIQPVDATLCQKAITQQNSF
jgi:hypothetical protein